MPYYPRKKKSTFKRKPKRFFKKRAVIPRVKVNAGLGFPKRMTMSHKYHELVSLNSTSGTTAFYKFLCNSMYDPNLTSTGHQPLYFDQMSSIYDHYTVIGAKISVKIIPTSNAGGAFFASLSQNDDSIQVATIDATIEQGGSGVRLFNSNMTSPVYPVMINKWSAKKTFGGSVLANDNLQGTALSSPSEQTVWCIAIKPCDNFTNINTYVDVTIQYIAVWDELKDVDVS